MCSRFALFRSISDSELYFIFARNENKTFPALAFFSITLSNEDTCEKLIEK